MDPVRIQQTHDRLEAMDNLAKQAHALHTELRDAVIASNGVILERLDAIDARLDALDGGEKKKRGKKSDEDK
jgi:hypothetical protein